MLLCSKRSSFSQSMDKLFALPGQSVRERERERERERDRERETKREGERERMRKRGE